MKRLALLVYLLPVIALAHPGGHGEFSSSSALAHALSEPDHLIGIAALAAVSVVGRALWRNRKRATQRARK